MGFVEAPEPQPVPEPAPEPPPTPTLPPAPAPPPAPTPEPEPPPTPTPSSTRTEPVLPPTGPQTADIPATQAHHIPPEQPSTALAVDTKKAGGGWLAAVIALGVAAASGLAVNIFQLATGTSIFQHF